MNIATEKQLTELRNHAVNDITRQIMADGVVLTHAQADDLGEQTVLIRLTPLPPVARL